MSSSLPSASQADARTKAGKIHAFFSGIAGIYDFFNRFFSLGVDCYWRHILVAAIHKNRPSLVLDLATGSGDVALALKSKGIPTIGADFCYPMLEHALRKGLTNIIHADALNLPLPKNQFDAVSIAFGLRNFVNRKQALSEILRVLKPGGKLLILEFSTPSPFLRPFYYFYLSVIMPLLTDIFFGRGNAYRHLNDSIREFPNQRELLSELESAGFCNAHFRNMTWGIAALHICEKPAPSEV